MRGMSSKAAAALARARWAKVKPKQRAKIARELNVARMAATTPEQRSEAARKGALKRWAKAKKLRQRPALEH